MHDSCPYVKHLFKNIADKIISVYVAKMITNFVFRLTTSQYIITRVVRCVYKNYFLFFFAKRKSSNRFLIMAEISNIPRQKDICWNTREC